MLRATHTFFLSGFRMLLMLAVLSLTASAFAEEEEKHPCHEPVEPECEVTGTEEPRPDPSSPNSDPTPYTGGNAPTNSASDGCEGSGCVNYEENYGNTFEASCESLFRSYGSMSLFERWGALPLLESCGKTAAAKSIVLEHITPVACEVREAMGPEATDNVVASDICARTCDKVKANKVPFGLGFCIEICKDKIKDIIKNHCP